MSITTGFELFRFSPLLTPVSRRLKLILTSGLTPRSLAATCCVGMLIGVMPLLAGTTLLGIAVASKFRLNQLAVQAVNYLAYPLQLALFIPFFKLGNRLLDWGPTIPRDLLDTLRQGGLAASAGLAGWITLKALVAWLLTAVPLTAFVYLLLLKLLPERRNHDVASTHDVAQPLPSCNHGDTASV